MPGVLTCSVVFPWVGLPISSIHSLRLQCVGCASYMRSSGAVPLSCFLFLALCTLFRLFLDFSHFSFFRRPSVTVFLSSQVIVLFCFVLFCCFFWLFFRYYYFIYWFILFFLHLLPCPADHEPDWQPRAVLFFSVCGNGWCDEHHNNNIWLLKTPLAIILE